MKSTYLFVLVAIFVTTSGAGCITPVFSSPLPSTLALLPSDVPDNFVVNGQTNVTQINPQWETGYLGGYYIQFAPETKGGNITGISQIILRFRANNVSVVYSASQDTLHSLVGRNVTHLVSPEIGDRSDAYMITDVTGNWDPVDYVILFTKNGIVEQVEVFGSNPDYAVAKNLAEKSAQKIR